MTRKARSVEPSSPRKPAEQLARVVDSLPHYRHLQRPTALPPARENQAGPYLGGSA